MNQQPPPGAAGGGNWFSEWVARTPVVCRCAILAVVPATLLGWLGGSALSLIPNAVLLRGEVWRVFTAVPVQDGALTLLVVCLMLAIQAPPFEVRRGSLPFLLHLLSSALLINAAHAVLGGALAAIPFRPFAGFGVVPGLGLWPVLLMLVAENALADPAGSTQFFCFTLSNPVYPWFLAFLFSVFSFFPMLGLFLGVALAHARA
jgi:hypothetical protein